MEKIMTLSSHSGGLGLVFHFVNRCRAVIYILIPSVRFQELCGWLAVCRQRMVLLLGRRQLRFQVGEVGEERRRWFRDHTNLWIEKLHIGQTIDGPCPNSQSLAYEELSNLGLKLACHHSRFA